MHPDFCAKQLQIHLFFLIYFFYTSDIEESDLIENECYFMKWIQ